MASKLLKEQMELSAQEMRFEEAAELKKKLDLLRKFQAKSTIVNRNIHNTDVFGIVTDKKSAYVSYMKVMNGSIVQGYTTELKKRLDETDEELLMHAIVQIRDRYNSTSKEIFLPMEILQYLHLCHAQAPLYHKLLVWMLLWLWNLRIS